MKNVISAKNITKIGAFFPDNHMLRCKIDKCKESVAVVISCLWRRIGGKKKKKKKDSVYFVDK